MMSNLFLIVIPVSAYLDNGPFGVVSGEFVYIHNPIAIGNCWTIGALA